MVIAHAGSVKPTAPTGNDRPSSKQSTAPAVHVDDDAQVAVGQAQRRLVAGDQDRLARRSSASPASTRCAPAARARATAFHHATEPGPSRFAHRTARARDASRAARGVAARGRPGHRRPGRVGLGQQPPRRAPGSRLRAVAGQRRARGRGVAAAHRVGQRPAPPRRSVRCTSVRRDDQRALRASSRTRRPARRPPFTDTSWSGSPTSTSAVGRDVARGAAGRRASSGRPSTPRRRRPRRGTAAVAVTPGARVHPRGAGAGIPRARGRARGARTTPPPRARRRPRRGAAPPCRSGGDQPRSPASRPPRRPAPGRGPAGPASTSHVLPVPGPAGDERDPPRERAAGARRRGRRWGARRGQLGADRRAPRARGPRGRARGQRHLLARATPRGSPRDAPLGRGEPAHVEEAAVDAHERRARGDAATAVVTRRVAPRAPARTTPRGPARRGRGGGQHRVARASSARSSATWSSVTARVRRARRRVGASRRRGVTAREDLGQARPRGAVGWR